MKRLLLAFALFCVNSPDLRADDDVAGLQGQWRLKEMMLDGKWAPVSDLPGVFLEYTFRGDRVLVVSAGLGGDVRESASYVLNSNARPKRIDLQFGPGDVLPGIYELEGNQLLIAQNVTRKIPPREFVDKQTEQGRFVVYVFERVKR